MKSYTCKVQSGLYKEYFFVLEYASPRITKYEIFRISNNFLVSCPNPAALQARDPREALEKWVEKFSPDLNVVRIEILSAKKRKDYYEERYENYLMQEYVDKSFFKNVWELDDSMIDYFFEFKNKNGLYSRWKIEDFLKARRLIPHRFAAIKLGIKSLYLDNVLKFLAERYLLDCCLSNSKTLIRMDSLRRIPNVLFQYENFESRDQFLKRFLGLLKEKGVKCSPDYCFIEQNVTRRQIFVEQLDMVINKPVSAKYCIPVQNGKPSYMQPDVISSYSNWISSGNFKLNKMINQTAIDMTKKMG